MCVTCQADIIYVLTICSLLATVIIMIPKIRKTETFAKWLGGLKDVRALARILVWIERLAAGDPGDVKPVGVGVSE